MCEGLRFRLGEDFSQCCVLELAQMSKGTKRKKSSRMRCFSKSNKQKTCSVSVIGLCFSLSLVVFMCLHVCHLFLLFCVSSLIAESSSPCLSAVCILTILFAGLGCYPYPMPFCHLRWVFAGRDSLIRHTQSLLFVHFVLTFTWTIPFFLYIWPSKGSGGLTAD